MHLEGKAETKKRKGSCLSKSGEGEGEERRTTRESCASAREVRPWWRLLGAGKKEKEREGMSALRRGWDEEEKEEKEKRCEGKPGVSMTVLLRSCASLLRRCAASYCRGMEEAEVDVVEGQKGDNEGAERWKKARIGSATVSSTYPRPPRSNRRSRVSSSRERGGGGATLACSRFFLAPMPLLDGQDGAELSHREFGRSGSSSRCRLASLSSVRPHPTSRRVFPLATTQADQGCHTAGN